MFDDTMIVQSALSAFNNAALSGPAFMWYGLLTIPLFILTYKYGTKLMAEFGWNRSNISIKTTKWCCILTLIWLILFGGNYAILRDNGSLLPFIIATVVFFLSIFVGKTLRDINLPKWDTLNKGGKTLVISGTLLCLIITGLSDTHAWWGPILQIASLALGLLIGYKSKRQPQYIPTTLIVMLAITTIILMQPEFFRFGQLGNLGPVHLAGILLMGLSIVATFALRYVKPSNKINDSAYTKIKWLCRVLMLLCVVLFILTESVPMFAITLGGAFIMFSISIRHLKMMPAHLGHEMFGLALILFGLITTMPVLSCLGILEYLSVPHKGLNQDFGFLL